MRSVTPITANDIDVGDGSYLRRVLEQTWQELPLLMLGALLLAAACLPAALLLFFARPALAGAAALLCAVPAWTAYCHLAGRIAVGRSVGLDVMPAACARMYWRSTVLAAPVLLLAYVFAVTRTSGGALDDVSALPAIVLTAAETVQGLVLLAAGCATGQALALLAAFDLPLRSAAGNSLLILLARPWMVLGLASLAYLLAAAAWCLGPAAWLLALVVYALFQVNATLMVSKQLLDAQCGRTAAAHANREEDPSDR